MIYTEGPWTYDEYGMIETGGIILANIEDISEYEFDTDEELRQAVAEAEGNGRLMAAAPDLYEAMTRLLAVEGQRSMGLGEWESALDAARAAIAKAEGKETTND